ncbi:MAG: VOC family protein [Steroidobacteraceae bacterium]
MNPLPACSPDTLLGPLPAAAIVQNAYIVSDLDEACARFHARYHIGPFVGGTEFELGSHVYRGGPGASVWVRGVFVQAGPLNVELIQVLSDVPSAFRDMFPSGEEGLHHVAMFCDDYERQRDSWVQAGYPVASEFTLAWGTRICYIDARRGFGHMIELYPQDAIIQDMYRQARDAANGWDGRTLVIPWA